jgi:hypothetical protein
MRGRVASAVIAALGAVTALSALSCGPKPVAASATGPAKTKPVSMPIAVVVWRRETPFDAATAMKTEAKDGVLRRTKMPEDDSAGHVWPFSFEYWGIARSDLENLLGPYTGRPVRVHGIYKKISYHDTTAYEVDPDLIELLPWQSGETPGGSEKH